MIQRCLGLDQATMFPSIPSESSKIGGRLHDCSSWIKLYTITRYRHRNSETSGSMPAKFALFARPWTVPYRNNKLYKYSFLVTIYVTPTIEPFYILAIAVFSHNDIHHNHHPSDSNLNDLLRPRTVRTPCQRCRLRCSKYQKLPVPFWQLREARRFPAILPRLCPMGPRRRPVCLRPHRLPLRSRCRLGGCMVPWQYQRSRYGDALSYSNCYGYIYFNWEGDRRIFNLVLDKRDKYDSRHKVRFQIRLRWAYWHLSWPVFCLNVRDGALGWKQKQIIGYDSFSLSLSLVY